MVKAKKNDKETVVRILSKSFHDNKSVNYVIKQDSLKAKRLERLMEYSFDYCLLFGEIYLSDDNKGCVLVVFPEKKKASIKAIWLDLKLALGSVGISNLTKVMKREAKIKSLHPKGEIIYLWFIGVDPDYQNKGIGSSLLKGIIQLGRKDGKSIYLETSTFKNISWYQKYGFSLYRELDDFGYRIFCFRLSN